MQIYTAIEDCRQAVRTAQREGARVGLVPTMGALHEGHLSLIHAAQNRCQRVAVTIFVNPTQFGPGEDFAAYPRPLDDDLVLCRSQGVDLVFTPSVETMYGTEPKTVVHVQKLGDVLCGPHRPGHFDGVATVVAKLFHILPADQAFFGEKDYQQLTIIRQMVRDLDFPIQIVGCPTVREPDSLAMSSRNVYLTSAQRGQAQSISRALFTARDQVSAGHCDAARLIASVREILLDEGPLQIDYVEVVDPQSLQRLTSVDGPARLCVAVRIGSTRLIDNIEVVPPARP